MFQFYSTGKLICKVDFFLILQNILGPVPYGTLNNKSGMRRTLHISIENLGQKIGSSLYTAAQNLGTTPIGLTCKDVGLYWYHYLLERIIGKNGSHKQGSSAHIARAKYLTTVEHILN